mgnify:CR=1 FL=1
MKFLFSGLFFLLFTVCITAQNESVWLTNFEEAKTLAAKENKQVLVSYSGSDWCRNCIRLHKQLFADTAFSKYAAQHLVLVKLDFPMRKKNKLSKEQQAYNDKLAEKYNSKGVFPLLLIFKDGTQIGKMNTNLPAAQDYIKELKNIK